MDFLVNMLRTLLCWINDRTGIGELWKYFAETPVPGRACWCRVWPTTILFTFCVQAITGFFLWAYYSPSAQTAWESVYFIQYETLGGWLLRAIHHYSAHVMLAIIIVYLVQTILTGAYHAPRELAFWATVGLGLCALAAVLTGDLLYWDQNGYASTKTRTGFLTLLPMVGESLLKIAIGGPGPALGHHSVTRFFALHVGVFAAAFAGLLIVRYVLARRANCAAATGDTTHFWPEQAWRSAVACFGVMVVILILACQHGVSLPEAGVPLLSPADTDPANGYSAARPEWFLVGVYEFSHLFPGELAIIPIFIVPGALVFIALAMPFVARRFILGHFLNLAFTAALLLALIGMTWYSLAKDAADPAHQKAIAMEEKQSRRVRELARNEGIPPTGALTLLRRDPKTQGPRLFLQHCASCHDSASGSEDDIKAEKSSAPNLAEFASRKWIAGILDPKQITGPQYYGNTKFYKGKMARHVKDELSDLDANPRKKEKLEKVVIALSAEAALPSQKELDARDAKIIEEGKELMAGGEFKCLECHWYYGKGLTTHKGLVLAKYDLTGYGSPEWTAGIIKKPTDKRFYGILNDRMPSYAASSDPAQNTLDPQQIEMLTNWLRGQWYEEKNQ